MPSVCRRSPTFRVCALLCRTPRASRRFPRSSSTSQLRRAWPACPAPPTSSASALAGSRLPRTTRWPPSNGTSTRRGRSISGTRARSPSRCRRSGSRSSTRVSMRPIPSSWTRSSRPKSFVGGSASVDHEGHGTFVAGLIAAAVDNSAGVAGMAPSAELLIAKVVVGGDVIDVEAEAKAIKWAVQNDAKVINLSLGGPPRPARPGSRHVLAARGGCCRLCLREGRRGRRCGRECRAGGDQAVAVRELPGRAAARPRCQRARSRRLRPLVLEPRQDLQRHRSTRVPESSRRCRSR